MAGKQLPDIAHGAREHGDSVKTVTFTQGYLTTNRLPPGAFCDGQNNGNQHRPPRQVLGTSLRRLELSAKTKLSCATFFDKAKFASFRQSELAAANHSKSLNAPTLRSSLGVLLSSRLDSGVRAQGAQGPGKELPSCSMRAGLQLNNHA